MSISAIIIGENRRQINYEKVLELSDSIKTVGLIHPITITSKNLLIAGLHRLEAHKHLSLTEIDCNVIDSDDELQIELIQIDENLYRNELTVMELCDILILRKSKYEKRYPETKHGSNQFTRGKTETDYPVQECFVSNTAKLLNKSESSVKAEIQISKNISPSVKEKIHGTELANQKTNLLELSKLNEDMQMAIVSQIENSPSISIKEAIHVINNAHKIEKRKLLIAALNDKIDNDFITQIDKKYNCIVIDPPWGLGEKDGMTCYDYNPDHLRGAPPYPTMELDKIEQIKIPADDDCVLFLWATQSSLKYAFGVMEKWGFTYKGTITWNKILMGLGFSLRFQCEFCLMGYKGNPLVNSGSEIDYLGEKRRAHSRKPEGFYQFVDRFVNGKKLDYFARQQRLGWDTYGVENDKFSNYTESIAA